MAVPGRKIGDCMAFTSSFSGLRGIGLAALAVATFHSGSAFAQQPKEPSSQDTIDRLRACQTIADASERLACYDREVGVVLAATDEGTLRVVDQQEVEQTKRSLFGFTLPKIKLFGDGEDEMTELATTITKVRSEGREGWIFTTEEGSTWRIAETKMGWRPPREGQPVVLKRASMGSFFIRVNGQIGVKGRRIE